MAETWTRYTAVDGGHDIHGTRSMAHAGVEVNVEVEVKEQGGRAGGGGGGGEGKMI